MLRNVLLDNKPETKCNVTDEQIINLSVPTFVFPEQFNYKLVQVSEKYVARPDRISDDFYGSPVYGDIICKLNGIANPFELNKDEILVLPEAQYINQFLAYPDDDDEEGDHDSEPHQKHRNEQRQPNESVVGERRFRIDTTRRVVTY